MTRILFALIALATAMFSSTAHAQRSGSPPVEFGLDGAATFNFNPSVLVLTVPVAQARVGFFATPRIELEPQLGLINANGGGGHFTQLQLELGMLLHSRPSPRASQSYLRPFVGLSSVSGGGGSSTSTVAGLGLGVKVPMGSRFAFRPELGYRHQFDRGTIRGAGQLQVLVGFSVFSH